MAKLTKEQNLILKDLSPEDRKKQIREWYQSGVITKEQFNELSLKSLKREINKKHPIPKKSRRNHRKNRYEIEMTHLRHLLNARLKSYLTTRNPISTMLNCNEYMEFKRLINLFPTCWDEVNKLLEIGLRYPEPALNEVCVEFIEDVIKKNCITNPSLWILLWESNHLVPNDTIRLMQKDGTIDPYFPKYFIKELIPLMNIQLEKELLRLEDAKAKPTKSDKDISAKEKDIERKNRRIEAFNELIQRAKIYIR